MAGAEFVFIDTLNGATFKLNERKEDKMQKNFFLRADKNIFVMATFCVSVCVCMVLLLVVT